MVERSWREKPRKELLRALVTLRTEMVLCQVHYERYVSLREQGDLDEPGTAPTSALKPHRGWPLQPRNNWILSLCNVRDELVKLDSVLAIFSPQTIKELKSYGIVENLVLSDEAALRPLSQNLGFDLKTNAIDPTFKSALQELDQFIKDNFKPEELYRLC